MRDKNQKAYSFPELNDLSKAFLYIFAEILPRDLDLTDAYRLQLNSPSSFSVGLCLKFVATCVKEYLKQILTSFRDIWSDSDLLEEKLKKLQSVMAKFSAEHFEEKQPRFSFLARLSEHDPDFGETVLDLTEYIRAMLSDVSLCFPELKAKTADSSNQEKEEKLTEEEAMNAKLNQKLLEVCQFVSTHVITAESPFLFFIDEAGILAKMKNFQNNRRLYTAFQVFRRALSYLDCKTRIFFIALGTKSSLEELSPPIIESSGRVFKRQLNHEPIILTQNFDIWKDEYPLDKMEPCYRSIRNCSMIKLLATIGHPVFSSVPFSELVNFAELKLMNGTSNSTKTYLMALWMLRACLACDPRSILASSLIENHMAVLFNVFRVAERAKPVENDDSCDEMTCSALTAFDVCYSSVPCLALGARRLNCSGELTNRINVRHLYFEKLKEMISSVRIDNGDLAESIAALLLTFAIDDVKTNEARVELTTDMTTQMKELCAPQFESLWDKREFLLEPNEPNTAPNTTFSDYKVISVKSYLKELLGQDEFEKIKPLLPQSALKGLINATHFVNLTRMEDVSEDIKSTRRMPPNANDLLSDRKRNIITREQLRNSMTRQCAYMMPTNYCAVDLCIPFLMAAECVEGKDGFQIVELSSDASRRAIPRCRVEHEFSKFPPQQRATELLKLKAERGISRPIYSYLSIQVKNGHYDVSSITLQQARFHFVPCPSNHQHSEYCERCEIDESLSHIFMNQISLFICNQPRFTKYKTDDSLIHFCPSQADLEITQDFAMKCLYPSLPEDQYVKYGCQVEEEENDEGDDYQDDQYYQDYQDEDTMKIESLIHSSQTAQAEAKTSYPAPLESQSVKPIKLSIKSKKRAFSDALLNHCHSINEETDLVTVYCNDWIGKTFRAADLNSRKVQAKPFIPSYPYDESRMNTIVMYGWDRWKGIIGVEGVRLAQEILHQLEPNPLRTVEPGEQEYLLASLKTFMSPALVGYDDYQKEPGEKDVVIDWDKVFTLNLKAGLKRNLPELPEGDEKDPKKAKIIAKK